MENRTKVILGIALVVAAGMLLFPPERGGGYDFVLDARSVDGAKVLVQLGLLALLAVALYVGTGWIAAHRRACVKTAQIAAIIAVLVVAGVAAVNYLPSAYEVVNPQYAEQVSRQSSVQGNTIRLVPVDYDPFIRRNPQITAWEQDIAQDDLDFSFLEDPRYIELSFDIKKAVFYGMASKIFERDEEYLALPKDQQAMLLNRRWRHSLENSGNQSIADQ